MIVENIGYLKKDQVAKMAQDNILFGIYKTHKNTFVLYIGHDYKTIGLSYPKKDRLPWKLVEGKKIVHGELVFSSAKDNFENHDCSKWNNGTQIIAYKDYTQHINW